MEKTIAGGDRIYEEMKADALSGAPLADDYFQRMSGEHEQVLDIIESIRQEAGRVYSVNLPNTGQVPNLPLGAIVESPAIADGAGLRAIASARFRRAWWARWPLVWPGWIRSSTRPWRVTATRWSRPWCSMASVNSLEMARQLADDLLAVQAEYLPQFAAR